MRNVPGHDLEAVGPGSARPGGRADSNRTTKVCYKKKRPVGSGNSLSTAGPTRRPGNARHGPGDTVALT